MRHQERVDLQQLKLPSKKPWNPSPSQSTIQALSNATRNVQQRKGAILIEPEAVKRLKPEMMTREKKKFAKKARLVPDLREKKLQVGKGPNAENAEQIVQKRKATESKVIFLRSEEACEEGFRIHFT